MSRGAVENDKEIDKNGNDNENGIYATDYKDQVQSLRRNWCYAFMARHTSTQRDAATTDTSDSDSSGGDSKNDALSGDGYSSSSCSSVSFTSSDGESTRWLVDTGATGHYADWGKNNAKDPANPTAPPQI